MLLFKSIFIAAVTVPTSIIRPEKEICSMKRTLLSAMMLAVTSVLFAQAAEAAACLTSDLSLTIGSVPYAPTDCKNSVGNGNPSEETTNLNAAFGTSGFVYLDKSDEAGVPLNGIEFIVTADLTKTGTWTVSWFDTNEALPLNLPIHIDFEVGLFGGSTGSGYYFEDVLLPLSPNTGTGTFVISFTNTGEQPPDLSHLTLLGKVVDDPVPAPEPASLLLLGGGLLGLGLVQRRSARRGGRMVAICCYSTPQVSWDRHSRSAGRSLPHAEG
jgi:hypothetical protein